MKAINIKSKLLLFVAISSVAVQTKAERHLWILNQTPHQVSVCPTVSSNSSYKEKPLVVEPGKSGEWWGRFLDNDSFSVDMDKDWESNAYWQSMAFGRDKNSSGYRSEIIDPKNDGLYNKDGNVVIVLQWFADKYNPFPFIVVAKNDGSNKIYGWNAPALSAAAINDKRKKQIDEFKKQSDNKLAKEQAEATKKQEQIKREEEKKATESKRIAVERQAQEAQKIKDALEKKKEDNERQAFGKQQEFAQASDKFFKEQYPILDKFVDSADFTSAHPAPWAQDPDTKVHGIKEVIKDTLSAIQLAVDEPTKVPFYQDAKYIREHYQEALQALRTLVQSFPTQHKNIVSELLKLLDQAESVISNALRKQEVQKSKNVPEKKKTDSKQAEVQWAAFKNVIEKWSTELSKVLDKMDTATPISNTEREEFTLGEKAFDEQFILTRDGEKKALYQFVDSADFSAKDPAPWSKTPEKKALGIQVAIQHTFGVIEQAIDNPKKLEDPTYIREHYREALQALRTLIQDWPAQYKGKVPDFFLKLVDQAELAIRDILASRATT